MAGHDPQRSSWAPEDAMPPATQPLWHKVIGPYIPSRAHLVTVAGSDGVPDMVYVPTARGVYALNAADGSEEWLWNTEMPIGHSPTVADGVLYVGCFDKRIHAVHAGTGRMIWKTAQAGAGFDTSPVVVNGKVYAGCRDGHFYCFDAASGALLWYFETGACISYSAAYADGTVYFASNDGHAYALDANTGERIWKSEKLPGDGFYGFWPVVNGDRVLFAGSNNYIPGYQLEKINRREAWPAGAAQWDSIGPVDDAGWIDASRFVAYLKTHPTRRTLFVLDRATGKQAECAPILWWGNPSGNRYPPAVGPDAVVYTNAPWAYSPDFPKGRIAAWRMGTPLLFPIPDLRSGLDSNDEPEAYAIIGEDCIYFNHDSDKQGGIYGLRGGAKSMWVHADLRSAFPGYCDNWKDRKYGNGNFAFPEKKGDNPGTHGNQNPPVPLRGRVYFHRSNAVVCFGPAGGAR
jgi:outer membrane protein assembly factor BamB